MESAELRLSIAAGGEWPWDGFHRDRCGYDVFPPGATARAQRVWHDRTPLVWCIHEAPGFDIWEIGSGWGNPPDDVPAVTAAVRAACRAWVAVLLDKRKG